MIHKESNKECEDIPFKKPEVVHRNLEQNMQQHEDCSIAGNFYYREVEMRRKGTEKKETHLWLDIYRFLLDYGEVPLLTLRALFNVMLLCVLIYWGLGCVQYFMKNLTPPQQLTEALYSHFLSFLSGGLENIYSLGCLGK